MSKNKTDWKKTAIIKTFSTLTELIGDYFEQFQSTYLNNQHICQHIYLILTMYNTIVDTGGRSASKNTNKYLIKIIVLWAKRKLQEHTSEGFNLDRRGYV